MPDRWWLVRTQLWQQPKVELFDMTRDPGQAHDVAAEHVPAAEVWVWPEGAADGTRKKGRK